MVAIDVVLLTWVSTQDRSDVGNAAVAGMDKDLNMTSSELSYCVAFFYIGFMLFQLPGAILVRVLTPPVQLGCAAALWGAATTV